jgi:hypothetical protein
VAHRAVTINLSQDATVARQLSQKAAARLRHSPAGLMRKPLHPLHNCRHRGILKE